MPAQEWIRTLRLDAPQVVRRLAELTGVRLTVDGRAAGGEVGAAYVRWPDGRRAVLTEAEPASVPLVELARAAGLPAPRYELTAYVDGAFVVVQELLTGASPATLDAALLDAMLELNGRMAGLLADRSSPALPLHLREGGPGFCLHEPLAGYDRRTARLLARVREVGAGRDTADGTDLVHLDFHAGNLLVDRGRITGLVDWDGAGRGDRYLDLVTLRFDLTLRAPALTGRLDDVLREAVPEERLRAYWAHMSLRLVDWAIRHHGPDAVDHWLAVAQTGLG